MPEGSVTGDSTSEMIANLARAIDSVFPGAAMTLCHRMEMDGKVSEATVEIPARGRVPVGLDPVGVEKVLRWLAHPTPKGAA